jgi:hypothetical protein
VVGVVVAASGGAVNLAGNSGNKSDGTLRVVIATDQPALTNKLLVTPDLPSGAATAAKQPALGTAGSASSDVITIQGVTSMTPVVVADGGGSLTVDGTVAVSGSVPVTDNSGSLTVDAPVGTPVFVRLSDGTSAISTLPVSLASVPSHAVTNAGTFAVQAAQSGTWNIGTVTPGTAATNLAKAEDAAHASGDVGVMGLAVRAAAPTDRSAGPTDGDYEPLAVNERGAVWASLTGSANGGLSTANASSSDGSTALTNSAQAIKASAGTLHGYYIYNPNATAQFVLFYNTASGSVTVGTTNPLFMLTIPATGAANLSLTVPVAFSTAMSWAATSTAGGNGAPGTALDAVCWDQ